MSRERAKQRARMHRKRMKNTWRRDEELCAGGREGEPGKVKEGGRRSKTRKPEERIFPGACQYATVDAGPSYDLNCFVIRYFLCPSNKFLFST